MDKSIQGYLGSLQLGEVQQFKNLAMVPVVSDYDDGLGYITLGDALVVGSIEIREVSEGGSVITRTSRSSHLSIRATLQAASSSTWSNPRYVVE